MRKTFKVFVASTAVIAGALVSTTAAQATANTDIIAADSNLRIIQCSTVSTDNAGLLNLDKTSLEATLVSSSQGSCPTSPDRIYSAAFNPEDGKVYVATNDSATADRTVYTIDMQTGAIGTPHTVTIPYEYPAGTPLTTTKQPLTLAINPQNGQAYAFAEPRPGTRCLYTLDLSAITLTKIVCGLTASLKAMAYSPNGSLYAWATTNTNHLVTVDTTTGELTNVANGGDWNNLGQNFSFNRLSNIAFDSQGTIFFAMVESSYSTPRPVQIWSSSPADNFATVTKLTGSNPRVGAHETVDTPWTKNPLSTSPAWNEIEFSASDVAPAIIITYGRQKLTFDANGGTADRKSNRFTSASQLALYSGTNAAITLPSATRKGYTFNGWFDAATGGTKVGGAGDSYTVPAAQENDFTLYAQWTKISTTSPTKKKIYFAPGSSVLNSAAKKTLNKIAKSYKTGYTIDVTGFVQADASTANNKSLSKARASAVAKYLKSKGVTVAATSGNGTPSSKAKSTNARRVTLTINPAS